MQKLHTRKLGILSGVSDLHAVHAPMTLVFSMVCHCAGSCDSRLASRIPQLFWAFVLHPLPCDKTAGYELNSGAVDKCFIASSDLRPEQRKFQMQSFHANDLICLNSLGRQDCVPLICYH